MSVFLERNFSLGGATKPARKRARDLCDELLIQGTSSVLGEDELHREVMMAATLNHWVTGDVGGRAGLFFSQSVAT